MKVVEQMLSRYAREEDHHALRGKQGHSLGKTGTLPNIPFAGCAVGTMVDHRAVLPTAHMEPFRDRGNGATP